MVSGFLLFSSIFADDFPIEEQVLVNEFYDNKNSLTKLQLLTIIKYQIS